ncbi:uncharacterized protein LOC129748331 [Uranotaenia lowii]|uniref:uncharacterized protein LOC129748331 n=1 Tax=Uranotaenia lowii TaxID=190385 RepID=UPI0024790B96|nr:uncharacterized protein LOC129748331 [Uranotaenia lowii]
MKLFLLLGFVLAVNLVAGHRRHDHNQGHFPGGGWHPPHHQGHRHPERHHWHYHVPFLNFEVHEPKGLEVSMVQRDLTISFFGIEVFVNRDPRSPGATCDICQNTTDVTYGKFIVEDDQAIIKKGDVLTYFVLMGNDVNVTRHPPQKLYVTGSIISKCNCETTSEDPDIDIRFQNRPPQTENNRPTFESTSSTPFDDSEQPTETQFDISEIAKAHQNDLFSDEVGFECDPDPVTNLCRSPRRLTQPQKDLQREVEILEGVIDQMKSSCPTKRLRSNSLILRGVPIRAQSVDELQSYVKSALAVSPELQLLAGGVQRVRPLKNEIVFEVGSYVDKQKILFLAKANNVRQVVDYD